MPQNDCEAALHKILSLISSPKADPNELLALSGDLEQISDQTFKASGFEEKKIAILSGYTTKYFAQLLRVLLLKYKINARVFESEYGLFEQAIYSKDEALKTFQPDICYFCVGAEHLGQISPEHEVERWAGLWKQTTDFLGCEIIQNTFEEPIHRVAGNFDFKNKNSRKSFIRQLNLLLAEKAPRNVHFLDVDFLASFHGRLQWRDEGLYALSKVPVRYDFWGTYVLELARVCSSIFGRSKKCLVLDLDNTLWGGVIGDDGVANLMIGEGSPAGESFKSFQEYVKCLKERGVLLAVCSKNEESIARTAFEQLPGMALKLDDFSCFVANWEPKYENLRKIATSLNIGLDSLVFFDDNPVERSLVRQALPEVSVIEVPENPDEYTLALSQSGYFETVALTDEDLARTNQYRENQKREELLSSSHDYESYLRSLEMVTEIAPFDEINLPRITQLINKTNQFNLTTKRVTESDIRNWMTSPQKSLVRYVKLRDKFGDNGLISAFVAHQESKDTFVIDIWVMSCRVLKRNVEKTLFTEVVQSLKKQGVRWLKGTYLPTEKNRLVQNLYKDLGFSLLEKIDAAGTGRRALPLTASIIDDVGNSTWIFDLQKEGL